MAKDMTAADLPRLNWRRFRKKTAYIFDEREASWEEIYRSVNRFANALTGLGVRKGDKVSILARNSIEFIIAYYGVLNAGAVLVPINILFGPREVAATANHSDAVALIVGHGFTDPVRSIMAAMPAVRIYVALDEPAEGFLSFSDLIASASDRDPEIEITKADDALILYTGGTTGMPKGALLTHGNHFNMLFANALGYEVKERDINLNILPLYHNAGLHITMNASFVGATNVLHDRVNAIQMMRDIERYGITRMAVVAGVWQLLLQTPGLEQYNADTMRWVMSAGSILTAEMFEKIARVFPNADFVQGYGLTDAASLLTILNGYEAISKQGSCGKASTNTEIIVADENDKELPPGQIGEILVRGDTVMKEYYKMPELSAQTLRNGWLHTGDLGRFDEDGYLYFVDRLKDIIRSGDETIFAMDLENIIYQHPAVKECAVIAVPHPKWHETPKAIVVLKEGMSASEEEILRFVDERLASRYMRPTSVDFWKELPRTHIGKIFKPAIREKYVAAPEVTNG